MSSERGAQLKKAQGQLYLLTYKKLDKPAVIKLIFSVVKITWTTEYPRQCPASGCDVSLVSTNSSDIAVEEHTYPAASDRSTGFASL
jgi:hypothetical protein